MDENTCPECGRSFPGKYLLKWHLESSHGIKPVDPLKCPECGLTFGRYDLLSEHRLERHGIESPRPSEAYLRRARFASDSLGSVIGRTFSIYVKSFLRLMAIAAIGQAFLFVITAGIGSLIAGHAFVSAEQWYPLFSNAPALPEDLSILALIVCIILAIVHIPVSVLLAAALIFAIAEQQTGNPPGILRAYAFSLKRLWSMVSSVLLIFLIILVASVIILVALSFLTYLLKLPAVVLFTILGLSGLILFMLLIRWSFVLQSALLEETGTLGSLENSWSLVSGNWWRVFGILLLFAVITGLIGWILYITLGRIPFIGMTLAYILILPLTFIAQTLLYFKLRADQQGSDTVAAAVESQIGVQIDTASGIPATRARILTSRSLVLVVSGFVVLCTLSGLAIFSPTIFQGSPKTIQAFEIPLNRLHREPISRSGQKVGEVLDRSFEHLNDVRFTGDVINNDSNWSMQEVWLEFKILDIHRNVTTTEKILVATRIPPGGKKLYDKSVPLSLPPGTTQFSPGTRISVKVTLYCRWVYSPQ
jgi:hypothetical protein